jgi:signal transduction histidine kinase
MVCNQSDTAYAHLQPINKPLESPPVLAWSSTEYLIILALGLAVSFASTGNLVAAETNLLEIRAVEVNGQAQQFKPGKEVNLGSRPSDIVFLFGTVPNAPRVPLRVRCKLDGFDTAWREGGGEMNLIIRYLNEAGDRLEDRTFMVRSESPGWSGTLETSTLTHRRETLTVPPNASRLMLVISSAGPASTTGIYVVDDLIISRLSTNGGKPEVLLRSPFDQPSGELPDSQPPNGWERDGIRPSMAKAVSIGQDPKNKAFAILDDDPLGHAEWHNARATAPCVSPNDRLVVEWNEMYSIGESGHPPAFYDALPPGHYRFRVQETTVFGEPTGVETTLAVRVPVVFWETAWFWASLAAAAVGSGALIVRLFAQRKLQRTMLRLHQQQALERERLRIAQDIHDDLGSRVTQISLASAMALNNSALSDKLQGQLESISAMSRDLVSALYETVWAVNPENDNLDAMVNYLCEKFNELCLQAQLRCRLNISPIPKNVEIYSRIRHHISLAAKEAMNNVIKHAHATQVNVQITCSESTLVISIQDNGKGFQPAAASPGNGLVNMKRRMEDVGGGCLVESYPGKGTTVHLRLVIESIHGVSAANRSDGAPSIQTGSESDDIY